MLGYKLLEININKMEISNATHIVYILSIVIVVVVVIYCKYLHAVRTYLKMPAAHFSRALDLMNAALAGKHLPGVQENVAYFTTKERRYVDLLTPLLYE